MKQTIIIRPNGEVLSPTLVSSYYDKERGKTYFLDNRFRVHEDALPAGCNRFSHTFDARLSPELKVEFDWTTDLGKLKRPEQERAKDWFTRHPNVEVVGSNNPNLVQPLFKMFALEDLENKDFDLFETRLKVQNVVYNMDEDKRKDLAFYFGINPAKMNDKKVLLELANPLGGFLMKEEHAKELLRVMNMPENKELLVRTAVKKAILSGKIMNRDGRFYAYGDDELLGVNEEDVFKYYFSNNKMYEFLAKEVGVSDFTKQEPTKRVDVETDEEIRRKAKSAGISGFYNMSIEKLKEALKHKEEEVK